ncbi:hypothetical protein [Paenibacillus sp. PL91]|uniref:hypothetical protein n=1 Tax=Paenibacillus sp. PL91 TaxID=2729538 RepID=UPI00145EF1BE|nr:hypothetical protein [Paenibacillus sp. PL91]MBC9199811.1 hypothetical protein [Paenibacillus sp. PL91]
MKMSKVIKPLLAIAGVGALGYVALKRKKTSRAVSDIVKVTSDAIINAEKSFGGLKQSVIDEIVSNTARGVKAVIDGDKLEYWYKSGSRKQDYMSSLTLDSSGKVIIQVVKGYYEANSPRIFAEQLIEVMKKVNNN